MCATGNSGISGYFPVSKMPSALWLNSETQNTVSTQTMADTQTVWAAIHALPKPVDAAQALQTGLEACGDDAKARKQWEDWMRVNGATLVELLNAQTED